MAIEQTDVIDLIGFNREKKLVNLVQIDERPWEDQDGNWDEEHLELLEQKVGAYIAYAKSRGLTDRFPEFKGLPVLITIESKYPLSPDADKYVENRANGRSFHACRHRRRGARTGDMER